MHTKGGGELSRKGTREIQRGDTFTYGIGDSAPIGQGANTHGDSAQERQVYAFIRIFI